MTFNMEKVRADLSDHENAIEEAQSCMCGRCHECGFDPEELRAALDEIERLQRIIAEPVESFGTSELIMWAEELQAIIAEYPESERGSLVFVMRMGSHLEKFSKGWNCMGMKQQAAEMAELEAAFLKAENSNLLRKQQNEDLMKNCNDLRSRAQKAESRIAELEADNLKWREYNHALYRAYEELMK